MSATHLKWTAGALATFRRRRWHWEEAARVDAAIIRFAEHGEGDIAAVDGDPGTFRLFVPPYEVLFEVDPEGTLITILGVVRGGRE